MNNTRNLLLVTIIAATLVLGTNVIPMQSYADRDDNDDRKKDNNYKSKTSASYESDKKSSKQNQDQDNFCYRGDDCEQANQGQQLAGKDNEAKGFNDQSDNLSVEFAADNGTGTGNGNGDGNGDGTGATCTAPLVSASVTFEGQTQIICVLPSVLSTLPVPVGGQCSSMATVATVVIGNETFSVCIISLAELTGTI